MAYSIQRKVSDGTLVLLDISISYIERSEISVLFDGVVQVRGGTWDWVGTEDAKLSFTPAVGKGVEVTVVRQTDLSDLRHRFSEGAAFTANSMDEALEQVLHIAQESAEQLQVTDFYTDLDMHGYIIKNIGIDPGAAVAVAAHVALPDPHPQYLGNADIGVSVQAYDADTVKTDVAQNFTLPQRSSLLTDNDGSFNLSAKQNFKCTPAGAVTLTFTNHVDGLSGSIIFINSSNHTISAHTNTKLTSADLAKLSASGTYRIDYLTDGTNAYCSVVGAYL